MRRRLLAAVLVGLAVLGLGAGLVHRPLLRLVGRALIVEEPLERADAIVVVAGSTPIREAGAAALFRDGWAPRVVVSRQLVPERVQQLMDLGIRPLDFQGESVLALERYGVPRSAIVTLGEPAAITEAELRAVAALARERGWRRVVLVTSAHHTRRVKLVWSRAAGGAVAALLVPVPDTCSGPEEWWRRRRCAELVLHEYLGLLAIHLGISGLMR